MNQSESGLKRGLKTRHMTMISIAGVIGAGLFVGSGSVIHSTGPSAIVSYALAGLLVIFIMRMLGEMSSVNPTSGSFSQYAHDAIGPWAGFTIGWLYWFFWVIVIAIEAIAGAGIIQYWFHDIPLWLTSLLLTILLTLTNVYSVKSFGEFEYWLSLIKVVTIVAFLLIGFAFIFGIAPGSEPVGLSNLTGEGGFFPKGISSVLLGIVVVIFSFMGTEIVAIAAGETSNPVQSVTKATRSVVWRIIVFYVGSIAIVVALLPWNSANILESPFVAVLGHIGVPAAAQIMNFIVLTAVLSCLNSGLYTTSRMLYSLAERKEAPRRFMKLSKKGVPVQAIVAGTFFSYIAVVMNYFSPETVFLFLVNSSGAIALLVYLAIAVSHLRMRKNLEKTKPESLKIKMWFFPYLTYLTIIAICGILVSMAFISSMRDELLLTGFITAIVLGSYFIFKSRKEKANTSGNHAAQQPDPEILP
ncbi:GABA permease [Bacillus atrophaeus]|uniref:GABA permease n=1 Tax=Bacillus atrophaeus TaxID=1452 RepID=UPI002282A214|nr:GABA permease [Bacillus atrophaeus]MCY8490966.1 GABA permease [Bacillus atrophaeus]